MNTARSRQREARNIEPIQIDVRCNTSLSQIIDPDGVLFEAPGVIALKFKRRQGKQVEILVLFDPVALKETEELSRVKFVLPQNGIVKKTAILNIKINITGPPGVTEKWAKKINTKAILRLINTGA